MKEPMKREFLDLHIEVLEKKVDQVLTYIDNNPASDPNCYEMNELMFEFADIGYYGRKFEDEDYGFLHDEKYSILKEKFFKMMDIRIPQLISEENGLYATELACYFDKSLMSLASLNRLCYDNVDEVRQLFNSICGVNLYVHQRVRDLLKDNQQEMLIYDNAFERANIVLGWTEYQDDSSASRPYSDRDTVVSNMVDEIENNYGKTLKEVLSDSKLASSKK